MSHNDYPARNFITSFERRFQEAERRIENMNRVGKVPKDGVKYDKEKKRWYVRLQDGEGDDKFLTDWLPWETASSAWMKISAPPHEGMNISMTSPCGSPENASCRPYHNNTDTPSPSDKPGEYHMRIEKPSENGEQQDKNKILDFHYTEDGAKVSIGDTAHQLSKDTISHKTKNNTVETEKDSTKATESHSLETKNRTVKADKTNINGSDYNLNAKVKINC